MKRCFDYKNNRLIYTGKASSAGYWDIHWTNNNIEKLYPKYKSPFDYVINISKKFLESGSRVIEGGCGTGQQVFKLQNEGYEAIGVDYAEKTIEIVKKVKPELDIRLGDVRKLDFEDNFFDGYWSFGVIEHFYDGYEEVLNEMHRVIKSNGYLFITFPHMSRLRKWKAQKNKYPIWENKSNEIKNFYQFALDEKDVITKITLKGFSLIKKQHLDGIKGLKDEIYLFKPILQKIYDSHNMIGLVISKIISVIFRKFSSHSILLVFKNK